VPLRCPTFRSTTWIESQLNEAERTRLYRDTRSYPCGSDSSAVAASSALGAPVLPQHPYQHRPQRPVLLAVDQKLGEGAHCSPINR